MPLKRSREQGTPSMYKSKLQEVCQQRGWEMPTYQVAKQGLDHNPLFSAIVTVNATTFSSPSPSSSSKKAQSDAAKLAFNHFSLISSSSFSLAGYSGGSAGENTRQSHENPTPLSNEAMAVAKNDESFGGSLSGSAGENTCLSPGGKLQLNLQDANPAPLSNEAVAVAKNDDSFGGSLSGSAGENTCLSPGGKLQLNLQDANPAPLSNEAVAVAKNDESFGGCPGGSAGENTRLSPGGKLQLNLQDANPAPLSNEAIAVAKNDESFGGSLSGSAGENTRLSPGGKLQLNLQDANPAPLSNEAIAVAKNDESFGGSSSGSTGENTCLSPRGKLQLYLQVANPTPLSNEAVAVAKNDESFGGFSSGSTGGDTRLSPRGQLQLNLQVANPTPLSNEAVAVAKNDESFGASGSLSPGGKLQLNLQDANPSPLSNEAVENAKNDEIFGGMQYLFKTQLQTYAQKRNFSLPVYSYERVGPPHASRFKCKVTVNGQTYESLEYFPTLNKAELAAAKAALMSLLSNGVEEDGFGYKSLLQELAQREGCGLPTYLTDKSGEAHAPTFVSKVEIEGEIFTGQGAKTKKQAEMSAAKIAFTALKQRYSSQSPGFLSTSSQFEEAPQSSPLSPAGQSQEAVQSETPQFSVSNLRAGLAAYLQQNIQPKLPVPNEQAEEDRANSVVSNQNPSIASPGQDSSSAMASITPSPAAAISSPPKHDPTSSSLPSDPPTNLATSSSIEFMVRGIRVLIHPSGTKMTYPAGSTVLPISDDKWAAVELPPQRSR
ncbi:double-stranded RNA-binding protein 1-like isoform X10 [Populus alba x Populus x berolinensis]|nr:double-stranded RNA-binding protein 1-like isoform X10 [Populus alba x Populus x berolinensis]